MDLGILALAEDCRSYASEGLLVDAVSPAFTHTPMTDAMMDKRGAGRHDLSPTEAGDALDRLGGMSESDAVLLFSYGTLRQLEVQLATFGRLLEGRETAVVGFRLEWLTITDPHVIATSGSDRHPLLVPSAGAAATSGPADATGSVPGTVFEISAAELAAADAYEVDDYRRVLVPLATGEHAWVYVFAG